MIRAGRPITFEPSNSPVLEHRTYAELAHSCVLHFRRVAAKPLLTNVNEQLLRAGPDPAL
jgi:hypothetical protein